MARYFDEGAWIDGPDPASAAAAAPATPKTGLAGAPTAAPTYYQDARTGAYGALHNGTEYNFTFNRDAQGNAIGLRDMNGNDMGQEALDAFGNYTFGGTVNESQWGFRDAYAVALEMFGIKDPAELNAMFSIPNGGSFGGGQITVDDTGLIPLSWEDFAKYQDSLDVGAKQAAGRAAYETSAEASNKAVERANATTNQQMRAALEANRAQNAAMGLDPNSARAQAAADNIALKGSAMGVGAAQQAIDSQYNRGLTAQQAALQAWNQAGKYKQDSGQILNQQNASIRSLQGQLASANANVAAAGLRANADVQSAAIRAKGDFLNNVGNLAFKLWDEPFNNANDETRSKADMIKAMNGSSAVAGAAPNPMGYGLQGADLGLKFHEASKKPNTGSTFGLSNTGSSNYSSSVEANILP